MINNNKKFKIYFHDCATVTKLYLELIKWTCSTNWNFEFFHQHLAHLTVLFNDQSPVIHQFLFHLLLWSQNDSTCKQWHYAALLCFVSSLKNISSRFIHLINGRNCFCVWLSRLLLFTCAAFLLPVHSHMKAGCCICLLMWTML